MHSATKQQDFFKSAHENKGLVTFYLLLQENWQFPTASFEISSKPFSSNHPPIVEVQRILNESVVIRCCRLSFPIWTLTLQVGTELLLMFENNNESIFRVAFQSPHMHWWWKCAWETTTHLVPLHCWHCRNNIGMSCWLSSLMSPVCSQGCVAQTSLVEKHLDDGAPLHTHGNDDFSSNVQTMDCTPCSMVGSWIEVFSHRNIKNGQKQQFQSLLRSQSAKPSWSMVQWLWSWKKCSQSETKSVFCAQKVQMRNDSFPCQNVQSKEMMEQSSWMLKG